tara:strand:+ start:2000 stop:2437 length:438 start_codon:yes stop_codon:yes gene_type:complete
MERIQIPRPEPETPELYLNVYPARLGEEAYHDNLQKVIDDHSHIWVHSFRMLWEDKDCTDEENDIVYRGITTAGVVWLLNRWCRQVGFPTFRSKLVVGEWGEYPYKRCVEQLPLRHVPPPIKILKEVEPRERPDRPVRPKFFRSK